MRDRTRGAHLSTVLRRTPFATWWWTVVALGALAILTLWDRPELAAVSAGASFWLLLGFIVLAELRPVVSSGRVDPNGVSLSTAFLFAILLAWGPHLALTAVVVATAVGEAARRKRLYAAMFNGAQHVLSYSAAWLVLWAFGWQASAGPPIDLVPAQLGAVVLAGMAYHLCNLVVVGTAIGLIEQRPLRSAIFENVVYFTMTTGAVLALSPLVVVVLRAHWAFLPLLLLPLSLLWKTAAMSLDREERALHDTLTGLANRTLLADHVSRHLDAGRPGALCLLDLDGFKEVNDTLGHAVGDRLLIMVGARLRDGIRDEDVAARIGGDEFVLLLNVEDGIEARDVVTRLGRALQAPYDLGGMRLEVEVSMGVSLLHEHGDGLEVLQRRADAAMYAAKVEGDLLQMFRPALERQTPLRLSLLAELRRGIEAGELDMHYQPKAALADGSLAGVEALVRWHHPDRGLLVPEDFLGVAERTTVMRSLTAKVLDCATAQLAVWRDSGLLIPVAVNVSLHDLSDRDFSDRVQVRLDDHRLDPALLTLEITEEALVGDPTRALATLDQLRGLGVTLSLDDFGTGHASLTRLKRLPVTEVKIDRSFVRHLDRSPDGEDAAIVRSVVELAKGLGLRSVAEGVETHGALRLLQEFGCDVGQGFLIAPPLPASEIAALAGRATLLPGASDGREEWSDLPVREAAGGR